MEHKEDLNELTDLPPPKPKPLPPPNTKSYTATVTKTDKDGNIIQRSYNKTYNVLSEEEKLNKLRVCRSAKTKLMVDIRKTLKSFENNYDALVEILKSLEHFKSQFEEVKSDI